MNQSNQYTATGTTVLPAFPKKTGTWTHSAVIVGTGAVSATVVVEGTQDPAGLIGWYTLCTLTPSGTDEANDTATGSVVPARIRHRVTAISASTALRVFTSGV